MARTVPRPFTMPWGSGLVVEEATTVGEHHEPTLQLLEDEDGSETIRFCSYTHRGSFQRSPLLLGLEDVAGLRASLRDAPRLRRALRRLVDGN